MTDDEIKSLSKDAADRLRNGASAHLERMINRTRIVGFIAGCVFMAVLDLTDLHICIGECDGAGYDALGERK